jgi:hypothetical protein
MAKRIATLVLTLTIAACGGSYTQSGQPGGRLSDADYRAAMERAARFVEPGSQQVGVSEEMARAIELDQQNEQQRLAALGLTPSCQ